MSTDEEQDKLHCDRCRSVPHRWQKLFLLVALTLMAYAPAMRAGWIWDDDFYVTRNFNLRDARGLVNIWTKLGMEHGGTPQYYPLTHTSFWIEYRLWGLHPAGYHIVNILLHAASAALLWIVLRKLEVRGAWLAAAVFALHPVHVESVAWVTERKNVLSGVFYFAALWVYLRFWKGGEWRWYVASIGLFIAALLSKTVTASLPAAILLIVWWKRGRLTRRDALPLLPMFLLGIAMGALTGHVEREFVIGERDWDICIAQRVLIAGRAVWFYAWKLICPVNLAFIYPRWEVEPRVWWQWIYPIAALALVIVLWMLRRRIGRGPVVAVLLFGGTLVPALGFVDVYPMRYSFVADHFQYLASVALVVLVVAALAAKWPKVARPAGVVVLIVLGVLTFRRAIVFQSARTLWADTITKNPTGWMPRNNLALRLMEQGDLEGAEAQLALGLKHNPQQNDLLRNLGAVMERRGQVDRAMELYRAALERKSDDAIAMTNLARLMMTDDREAALRLFERAVEMSPHYAPPHVYIGLDHIARGDFRAAEASFRRAVELDPSSAEAWNNLGATRENLGDVRGAIDAYQRAVEANPKFDKARRNLGRLRLVR